MVSVGSNETFMVVSVASMDMARLTVMTTSILSREYMRRPTTKRFMPGSMEMPRIYAAIMKCRMPIPL